jgi:acetyl/propionyl-CoA carboxylase alpha subunit
VHYDPMISKLVVWGEDRPRALARMRRALDEYQVRGIETNLAFHRRCVRQAAFAAGDYDTGFIARHAKELAPRTGEGELEAAIIAAALDAVTAAGPVAAAPAVGANHGPSGEMSAWRRQLR